MKHHAAHQFSSDCFSIFTRLIFARTLPTSSQLMLLINKKSEVLNFKIPSVLESRHVSGESGAYLLSSEKSDVKCICDFPLS